MATCQTNRASQTPFENSHTHPSNLLLLPLDRHSIFASLEFLKQEAHLVNDVYNVYNII